MELNWIDLLLVSVFLAGIAGGWRRGFAPEVLDLAGWLGSLWAGLRFHAPLAAWIAANTRLAAPWSSPLAFFLVFLAGLLVLRALGARLLDALGPRVTRHRAHRVLGILPGAANGFIHAIIGAALLTAVPLPARMQAEAGESALNTRLAGYAERVESKLRPVFESAARATLGARTARPGAEDTVQLGFSVKQSSPRAELEARMLELLNGERAAAGLPPLKMDEALTRVARQHSADMLARGYFSHYSPEGKNAFDRMRTAKIAFLVAGENLAFAPTVKIAHTGLMNSPGHRANILRAQFRKVGIGIMDAGPRGIMVTQQFSN